MTPSGIVLTYLSLSFLICKVGIYLLLGLLGGSDKIMYMKHRAWCLAHNSCFINGCKHVVNMANVSKNEHICQTGVSVTVHLGGSGLRHRSKALSQFKNQLSLDLGSWAYREITLVIHLLPVKVFLINSPVTSGQPKTVKKAKKFSISFEKIATFMMVPRCVSMKGIRSL